MSELGRLRTVLLAAVGASTAACGPSNLVRAEYTVEVRDTAAHVLHVTAKFSNLHQARLRLSLPIWTPGWYTLEYYGKNVVRLEARNGSGESIAPAMTGAQTWSVDTQGQDVVSIDFDYLANVLAANQAIVNGRYAFFTGTQLFLEPIGHRDVGATVRFIVPEGWSVVSALRETRDAAIFAARNYDELVDAPTWIGRIEVHEFDVSGKRHLLALERGRYSADTVQDFVKSLARVIDTERAVFGSLPFDKYVFFVIPGEAQSSAGSLEHGNSMVLVGHESLAPMLAGYAHEFFHLWNVKRIRPAEMWPYDYSRPNETPSLWFSEGVTRYYADLTMYRAGFMSDTTFLEQLAEVVGSVEANPAGGYVSPSAASVSTWQDYGTGPPLKISYYFQGQSLGALLDLSILHDTQGERGLDDVMRALYANFYLHGRGFTSEDLIRTVSATAGHDYSDFFRRYVTGIEAADYDRIFGYGGVRLRRSNRILGFLGAEYSHEKAGVRIRDVEKGGPAQLAGLQPGDVIVAVDGVPVEEVRMPYGCCITVDKGVEGVRFAVLRGGERLKVELLLQLGPTADTAEYDPSATPEELKVREAWLARR